MRLCLQSLQYRGSATSQERHASFLCPSPQSTLSRTTSKAAYRDKLPVVDEVSYGHIQPTYIRPQSHRTNMAYHYQDRPSRQGHTEEYSPSSSGNATPITTAPSSYLHSFVGGLGGLVRRFSDMTSVQQQQQQQQSQHHSKDAPSHGGLFSWPHNGIDGVYTPPINRSASPMRPPPLEPLELRGFREDTKESARLLTPAVAEEIRIMVPERQRIEDEWNLVYSLDQDGASLGTLYKKCIAYEDAARASFVLVVKDNDGGVSSSSLDFRTPYQVWLTRTVCSFSVHTFPIYHVPDHITLVMANASSGEPLSSTQF